MPFLFTDTATTEIYTLSLHDALPIWPRSKPIDGQRSIFFSRLEFRFGNRGAERDRKSTRLNSSHANISYAVFCLKKKKKTAPDAQSKQTSEKEQASTGRRLSVN